MRGGNGGSDMLLMMGLAYGQTWQPSATHDEFTGSQIRAVSLTESSPRLRKEPIRLLVRCDQGEGLSIYLTNVGILAHDHRWQFARFDEVQRKLWYTESASHTSWFITQKRKVFEGLRSSETAKFELFAYGDTGHVATFELPDDSAPLDAVVKQCVPKWFR